MIETDYCVGVVVNKDQKKFLYRKIDASVLISFISGGMLGIGVAILNFSTKTFWGVSFVILSFLLFFVARYLGLKILFTEDDFEEDKNGRE